MTIRKPKKTIDGGFDEVDKQFAEVREQFAAVGQRFEAVDRRFDSLEQRIAAEGETYRRHLDVVAEEFRSLVRLGLDRQMATEQQIRQLAASHAVDHAVYTAAIQDHETRVRALEPRDSSADETS